MSEDVIALAATLWGRGRRLSSILHDLNLISNLQKNYVPTERALVEAIKPLPLSSTQQAVRDRKARYDIDRFDWRWDQHQQ